MFWNWKSVFPIFNFGNHIPKSKNILNRWSRIYTTFLLQNWEYVPETETCVPFVPNVENSFPQKFCLKVPVGKPSFRGIESIALIFRANEFIFSKVYIISSFDLIWCTNRTGRVCLFLTCTWVNIFKYI